MTTTQGKSESKREPRLAALAAPGTAITLAALFLIGLVVSGIWGDALERHLFRPLQFSARDLVGKAPALHPGLRVYRFDESTARYLGRREMTLEEWRDLLQYFARAMPRAILVADEFEMPWGREGKFLFSTQVSALSVPVIAGVSVQAAPKPEALSFPPDRSEFDASLWSGARTPLLLRPQAPRAQLTGPDAEIRSAFHYLGHMNVEQGAFVSPYIALRKNRLVPMAPAFIARDRKLQGGSLILDGQILPGTDQPLLVNFPSRQALYDGAESLKRSLQRLRSERSPEPELRDTVIVVVPDDLPGHLQAVSTPVGKLPRGYIMAAVTNSLLTGHWLKKAEGAWLYLLLGTLLGGIAGLLLHRERFLTTYAGGIALSTLWGMWAFIFGGWEVPWGHFLLGWVPAGLALHGGVFWRDTRRVLRIREALGRKVPAGLMKRLLRGSLELGETTRLVTIVSVDITGFSGNAGKLSPEQTFAQLRGLLDKLIATIHEFGGVVEQVSGDSLVCFFGYHLDGGEQPGHGDAALHCAIKLQRDNARRMVEAGDSNEAVFPLRIGINTSPIHVGSLQWEGETDLTLVGPGVTYAKHLEAACDHGWIMVSATTRDILSKADILGTRLTKRYIRIKNYELLQEAWECDPLAEDAVLKRKSLEAHRQFSGLRRRESRWVVPPGSGLTVRSEEGTGEILDFSESGLRVRFSRYLGKNVTLTLLLHSRDGELERRLKEAGIPPLLLEVRWGYPLGDEGYHLGLLVRNLNEKQKRILVEHLRKCLASLPLPQPLTK